MTNYNFLKYKQFFVSLSTVMTIGCLLIILIKGFNYGVDFKGGTVIEIRTEKNIHVEEIRTSISKLNINNYTVKNVFLCFNKNSNYTGRVGGVGAYGVLGLSGKDGWVIWTCVYYCTRNN